MVAMLRRRTNDVDSTRWTTDTPLTAELLLAARFISRQVELKSIFPMRGTATQTLSIVSGTTEYTLNSDFAQFRKARRTDGTPVLECHEIDGDDAEEYEEARTCFDAEGRVVFYLDSSTAGAITFNLPYDPKRTMTIVVKYFKTIADVSGGTETYAVPDALHELVVLRAGIQLLGLDAAQASGVGPDYQEQMQQAKATLRRTKRRLHVRANDGII